MNNFVIRYGRIVVYRFKPASSNQAMAFAILSLLAPMTKQTSPTQKQKAGPILKPRLFRS